MSRSSEGPSQLVIDDLEPEIVSGSAESARHLLQSLRARPGDTLWATDGRGRRARLRLERASRAGVTLAVLERRRYPLPERRWWLASRAEGARFDWVVEKAVELGAWGLIPLPGRGRASARADRSERWARLARAALGQSFGVWGLAIRPGRGLSEVLAGGGDLPAWAAVVWAEAGGEPPERLAVSALPAGDLLLAVGPPEGFGARERERLAAAPGARALALAPRRLRSETAALAALAWAAGGSISTPSEPESA